MLIWKRRQIAGYCHASIQSSNHGVVTIRRLNRSTPDLYEFRALASARVLLETSAATAAHPSTPSLAEAAPAVAPEFSFTRLAQSILFWRFRFFDPDKLFNRLEPRLGWIWTAAFFWLSLVVVLFAGWQAWAHWREYAGYLFESLRWETAVLAWLILF